jgi:hypothetical protein
VERREVLVLFNPEYDPDTCSVANGQRMADFGVLRVGCRGGGRGMDGRSSTPRQPRTLLFSLNRYLFLATKRS